MREIIEPSLFTICKSKQLLRTLFIMNCYRMKHVNVSLWKRYKKSFCKWDVVSNQNSIYREYRTLDNIFKWTNNLFMTKLLHWLLNTFRLNGALDYKMADACLQDCTNQRTEQIVTSRNCHILAWAGTHTNTAGMGCPTKLKYFTGMIKLFWRTKSFHCETWSKVKTCI